MAVKLPERDLVSLFSAYGSEPNLDSFMKKALDSCVEWFDAERVSLFLRNDYTSDYVLSGQAGPDSSLPTDTAIKKENSVAAKAIAGGKPMLLDGKTTKGSTPSRGGSAMIVPLITQESGCIGVLNVARGPNHKPFSGKDLNTAETIAQYVALAINNAQHYSRMNHAVGQARAMSDKLDAVIACLGVGVLVVSEYEEITGWNPEAQQLFGGALSPGILLRHVLAKVPLVLKVTIEQSFLLAAGGEKISRRAFDSSADLAWSVIASPLPAGGATLAIQDISEHERAYRELSRVRRLAEIGQMTAAVAHEIRNPLTGIRTAAQMVQGVSDEASEYGKIIEEEALKLNSLCDQFLEFARPVALNIRDFEPADVVTRICKQHLDHFKEHGITLTWKTLCPPPMIKGDPLRLEQVTRNLLLNALQACGKGGRVEVEIDGPHLRVKDSGHGIEPQVMDKLFTPFFTTKAYGTGLGLSTVRKIVDAHGWAIEAHNIPGSGACFEVDFGMEEAA